MRTLKVIFHQLYGEPAILDEPFEPVLGYLADRADPGGCSRAQRYPQTLQRQTGRGRTGTGPVGDNFAPHFPFPAGSGEGGVPEPVLPVSAPFAIASLTYSAQ